MKTLKKLLLFVVASALLAGCTSYKNVPYMQNPEVVNSYREDLPLYDAKIMPKDLLSITVNTSDPQAAAPFNLTVQTPLNAALTNINTTTQPTLQQYLVNNKGEIDFPRYRSSEGRRPYEKRGGRFDPGAIAALSEREPYRYSPYGKLQNFGIGRGEPSGYFYRRK